MGIGQTSLSYGNVLLGVLRLPLRELSNGGGTMWKLEVWVHSNNRVIGCGKGYSSKIEEGLLIQLKKLKLEYPDRFAVPH